MYANLLSSLLLLTVALSADSKFSEPNHKIWDALLANYVDSTSRVDYERLKKEASGHLDTYAQQLALARRPDPETAHGKALLINAYNSLVVRWIVQNYPTKSIMATPNPFRKARHTVAGEKISLDEIESWLRTAGDPRIHAAVVCAARSCPPLRTEAYFPERVDQQLEDNTRRWMADSALNEVNVTHGYAKVSAIFEWYEDDFTSHPGGLDGFLRRYAPPTTVPTTEKQKLRISIKDYHWGLNDQSDIGAEYSTLSLAFDWLKNWFL